eukprot:11181282-Lingulodinium_polyedra.AAC.1
MQNITAWGKGRRAREVLRVPFAERSSSGILRPASGPTTMIRRSTSGGTRSGRPRPRRLAQ